MKKSNYYLDTDLKKSNRDKVLSPRKGCKGWCDSCDSAILCSGQRCPCCGNVQKIRRLKKD